MMHAGLQLPPTFPHGKKGPYNFVSQRKVIDYYASAVRTLENRLWQRDKRDRPLIQPDLTYYNELALPLGLHESPVYSVTTKFVRASANKSRCPMYCISWVPDGRRLITGAASGEFTLWNGINFNFESILQGHDCSVRSMTWSHNGVWMTSTDDRGFVKYWQANLNNVHTFQAHNDPVRSSSFSPTDTKLATCSEDGTIRTFDFVRCAEEFILRGHGADVMSIDWHPRKSLLASGSKDNQQPVKLWDPKAGQSVATIHAHKATVQCVSWNRNGNWLLTAARDTLIKVFDIRNMKEIYTLKGHKKDVNTVAWHPVHESLFASGGGDGSILFWSVGNEHEIGGMESAHDSFIWDLSWHPLGHILVSCSSDHTSKFWCRNRPGEEMRDRYNTASALITEDAVEETYQFPVVGGSHLHLGGGATNQRDAITLPPPSWSSQRQLSAIKVEQDTSQQTAEGKADTPLNVPVLGADIIAEQFGDKPKVPTAPVAPGNQATPTSVPSDSPFSMPPQRRPFDEQGHPPPDNMNFPHPNMERVGISLQGAPPPPPDQFRHPPPDQREWHGRGPPPPGREFVRPEFRGPPTSEFNRSSPYSWQRNAPSTFRERRPSYDEHRFPPQDHANPYVYRRPEPEQQRDPRDPRRPDWREGPAPPRRQQPWDEGQGAPPHSRPAPMREEFPERAGPGAPRRPSEEFERHGEFHRESFDHHEGRPGGFPPPPGQRGQEQPPPQAQQPSQGPQPREMWERGPHPPPPQQQHPQGQPFPDSSRQQPLDPRAQGRQEHQRGGAPPTSAANEPQRREFPHAPPPPNKQPQHPQHGAPPRDDQPHMHQHGMYTEPHPPRSEAQGQRFNERLAPGSDAQRPRPPPTSEALQRPGVPSQQAPSMTPTEKFFQQQPSPHTTPPQGQPRFPGPPPPGGLRPPPQEFGGPGMRMRPRGPPPNQQQRFPPPSRDRPGPMPPQVRQVPPPHDRQGPAPPHERQGHHPPHERQGFPPRHEGQGPLPPPDRQGLPPHHERQGPPPPHDRQGPPPPHERQGLPPPQNRQGPPPPQNRQGPPPPHDRQGPPPPHDRQGLPPPHDRQGPPHPHDRLGPPLHDRPGLPPPHDRQGPPPPHERQGPPHHFQSRHPGQPGPRPQHPQQQQFRGHAPPTAPSQAGQVPRHPTPADPRMNRAPTDMPPPGHHLPPPGHHPLPGQHPPPGQQFGGPPHGHPQGSGHYDSRGQAPPPGHMQQPQQQGSNSPHWSGPRGGPPPPQFRDDSGGYREGGGGEEHYEHSRDPRDRKREPHPPSRENKERDRHDRSSPHRRSSNERDVPSSKRPRVEKKDKDDRSSKLRSSRPKRD